MCFKLLQQREQRPGFFDQSSCGARVELIYSSASFCSVFCVVFNQGESEISDEEETDDEINDPQYLPDPDSDSDSDGDSTNRLAKLKLPGNNRNQGDSKIQSAAVRGRRGRGGGTTICFLCQKEFPRIDAHLKTHMSEDADIAQAFGLPAGSKQRKELLEKLRNRGNSLRDGEVLKTQCEGKTSAKRKSCVHCKGMFSPYRLSTHVMNCSSKPEEKQQQEEEPELVILACSSDVRDDGVLKILGHLHEDVARALSSDLSLDLFSKSLYSLHGHDPAKHNYIRQKILELGRFLLAMRKTSPVLTLADVVKPANFLNMVKVVKEITGFDTAQEIPSHALRIGQSLFEVSDIVQCQALLIGDQELVNSTTEFKKLYQAKWPEYISQSALTAVVDLTDGSPTAPDVDGLTAQLDGRVEQAAEQNCPSPARQQTHQTANKPSELPPAEDVGMLHNHLDHKAKSAAAALKEQPTAENYSSLARATLSKMVLLNHEQVSELSKMKLQNFLERECLNKLEEVGLTEYEQKLCCYFQRVGLKGSGGREVAALLTPPLVTALDLLIGKRRECGVPDDNDYLFAVPKCQTYYRGHQSLGLFADKCGAQRPDYLRSARLRKRVAIASRIVSFRDHELDRLSTFLGQEVAVQRRFCWLSEPNEQSARISTLLQALEKGKLHQVQEKSPVGFEGTCVLTGFDAQCWGFVALP